MGVTERKQGKGYLAAGVVSKGPSKALAAQCYYD